MHEHGMSGPVAVAVSLSHPTHILPASPGRLSTTDVRITPVSMDAPEPKRRNAAKTRARILAAALDAFADHGYAKTGIREIAARAGVASSLLVRYFSTKANLFEEALTHAIYANSVFTRDRRAFGERMAQMIVAAEENQLTAMMVLAIADPDSKAIAQKVSKRHVIDPLAEWLGPPHAHARALEMLTLFTGFAVQMQHIAVGPIPLDAVKWLARSLQDIVDRSPDPDAKPVPRRRKAAAPTDAIGPE
jgi:AcrR family transcriptional regulator